MVDFFLHSKVSVIIPTFNRADFITNAINSVVKQGHKNIEIIIVDDGSTDNTAMVVGSLQKQHSNILYCPNERAKGPSGARNTGILRASGEYLALLDSDDIWLDHHLTNGLGILTKHPEIDVLFGNFNVVDFQTGKHLYDFFAQKKILHSLMSVQISPGFRLLQDNLFEALIQENFFHLTSAIIRKSSAHNILLDESIMFSEDRDFAIRLYKEAHTAFAYREDPVFVFHRHDSHLYSGGDLNTYKQVIEAHLYMWRKYLTSYHLSHHEKKILSKLFANRLLELAAIHRKQGHRQKALVSTIKSFKYGLSLNHFEQLARVLAPSIQINKSQHTCGPIDHTNESGK